MSTPTVSRGRSGWLKLDDVGAVNSAVPGLSVEECGGSGAVRQTVFTFNSVAFTLTDNGANGSGGLKLYDFVKGITHILGGSGKLTISYGTVTDANLIGSVGTVTATADGALTSTEANIIPSTACATTAGAGTFTAKSTTTGVVVDGSSAAASIFLNLATSSDPGTNNSITITGKLMVTWLSHGDAASVS